jgi:hypothetical protein
MERAIPEEVRKLRSRAAHYRALAARAENCAVGELRMRTATLLEREAAYTESAFTCPAATTRDGTIELDQGPYPPRAYTSGV